MNWTRFLPVFSVAAAMMYVLALYYNLALFTYHPAIHEWQWLAAPPKAGPAMYWYGWLATSVLGAAAVAALASLVPTQWQTRAWSGLTWLIPLAGMLFIAFILRGYFIR